MYHRYGRHGPHAWKRRRQRRYERQLPVILPSTTAVIHVRVPITTERIILIIMPDNREVSEFQEGIVVPHDGDQTGRAPVTTEFSILPTTEKMQRVSPRPSLVQKMAERQAYLDAMEIRDRVDNGQYITFDQKRLARRIRLYAARDISPDYLRDDAVSGYEDLLAEYEDAYQRKFYEHIRPVESHLTFLRDEKEQRLRARLTQDRLLVQTRSPGDWHARDLVLLRLLQIYYSDQLELVNVDTLLEQHGIIDRYEKFVLDVESRNEVIWPDQEPPFRS